MISMVVLDVALCEVQSYPMPITPEHHTDDLGEAQFSTVRAGWGQSLHQRSENMAYAAYATKKAPTSVSRTSAKTRSSLDAYPMQVG